MKIRKSKRRTKDGWSIRYTADAGIDPKTKERRRKSCKTHAAAKGWLSNLTKAAEAKAAAEIETAAAGGLTLSQIADKFVADRKTIGRERSTYEKYEQHFRCHINVLTYVHEENDPDQDVELEGKTFGSMIATQMRPRHFVKLRQALTGSRSHEMALKVWSTLASSLDFAIQIEACEANLARSIKIERQARKLAEKVEIPSRPEIAKIMEATRPQEGAPIYIGQAMIATTLSAGLRPSEMRAITWPCASIDVQPFKLSITERVDQWRQAGPPKSAAGYREIPIPESTARLLREWRLKCPKGGDKNLVFPNSDGGYQDLSNIHARVWRPFQIALDLAERKVDADGKPILDKEGNEIWVPRYTWYALRHAYASMQIAIGIQPKKLQERMGHASLQMTMDLYGHLWTDHDQDAADMAALEIFMKNLPREN